MISGPTPAPTELISIQEVLRGSQATPVFSYRREGEEDRAAPSSPSSALASCRNSFLCLNIPTRKRRQHSGSRNRPQFVLSPWGWSPSGAAWQAQGALSPSWIQQELSSGRQSALACRHCSVQEGLWQAELGRGDLRAQLSLCRCQ